MRTFSVVTALVLSVSASVARPAQAAVVSRFVAKGTTANISIVNSVPGSLPGCTIDIWVVLTGAASIERSSGTRGSNASGFVQRVDNCAGQLEFGSFDMPLTNGFQTDNRSASLTTNIPVEMQVFSAEGGTVIRTLSVDLDFVPLPGESVATKTHSITKSLTFKLLTSGHSLYRPATVTGLLTFDGIPMMASGSSSLGSIDTGSNMVIEISRE